MNAKFIKIANTVDFRRAVQEYGFATAATTISSISGGNDGPAEFEVIINDVRRLAVIGYVHPLPFVETYIGATVLVGVFDREEKLSKDLLPENFNRDAPVTFTVQITAEHDGNEYRAYSYSVLDSTLRLVN